MLSGYHNLYWEILYLNIILYLNANIRGRTMPYVKFAFKTVHNMLHVLESKGALQTRLIDQILVYCWVSVADGGPTVGQYWISNITSAYGVFKMV